MKTQIAAIDFGTSKIVTVIAQNGGVNRLDMIGSGTVPYDGFSEGYWNTPTQMIQRVRDSVSAAELEAHTKVKEVYIGVPGEYIMVRCGEFSIDIPDDATADQMIDALMDKAADELEIESIGGLVLHRSPAWFKIDDGRKTMLPTGRGSTLTGCISFIVADPDFIDDVTEICGRLNLTILGFLSSTLGEGLLLLSLEDRDRVSVLIDSGYLNTEISLLEGDAIIYHAMIDGDGGGYIASDLADALHISMRAAEQIKRSYVFNPDEFEADSFSEVRDDLGNRLTFPREVVGSVIESAVEELCKKLAMSVNNDIAPYLSARSTIHLTGGGITLMRGVREYVAAKLGRAIRISTAKTSKMNSPIYSSTLGLADIIFDSVEQNDEPKDDQRISKVKRIFKR